MKKLRDLERLKLLLLTEDQRVIFDNLPKPDLFDPIDYLNELELIQKGESEGVGASSATKKSKVTLDSYYERLLEKPKKSLLDVKLIEWFEKGIDDK